MSVYSGPEMITDGLILHLDASNRSSFAGVGAERVGGILPTFGNWNGLVGTSTAYTSPYGQGVNVNITAANGGGVNWWYSNNGAQACLSNTQYVITARVRYSGGTPDANLFYVRQFDSGASQTSEGGKYSSSNQIDLGDGSYLAWAYFTTDATATSFYVHGYDYKNISIWLEDVQCKLAGLKNLAASSNDGSLTGAMTRLSTRGGVLRFSGDNYITTGLNLSTGAYTVMAAARYVATSGRIITAVNNNWLMGHWGGTTENHYAQGWVSASSVGAADGNWRILSASGNTSTDSWQMYVNGNQTYSNNAGSAGPNNLGINAYSTERSNGEVGFLMAYNRVLSSSEIKQNFQAMRSRFGI